MDSVHNVSIQSSLFNETVQTQNGNAANSIKIATNVQKVISYATVIQKEQFPTKDQAVILDSIDGIQLKEYTQALGKLINPTNIRFVSRISKNRVCMYLANKDIADKLTVQKTLIQIGDNKLEIRPLMTKYKRIIMSNVCPIIPHYILGDELNKLSIRLGSSITFLRAGLSEPGYTHILSFRRQVYIHPEDISKLPESLKIHYDDTSYWVYLSAEAISCFICKQVGHIAKNCRESGNEINNSASNLPSAISNEIESDVISINFPPLNIQPSQPVSTHGIDMESDDKVPPLNDQPLASNHEIGKNFDDNFPPLNVHPPLLPSRDSAPTAPKRPLSISSNDTELSHQDSQQTPRSNCIPSSIITGKIDSRKKSKVELPQVNESINLEEQMEPLKEIFSSPTNSHPLNFLQLKSLIEKSKTVRNATDLTDEFTPNTEALIKQLEVSHRLLTNRGLKRRITILKKKLLPLQNDDSTMLSDCSVEDS